MYLWDRLYLNTRPSFSNLFGKMEAGREGKGCSIKKQMTKFGWKEGQGLGKNEQGMKDAIKVSLKNNKNGLGLDPSEQFVFHWWDHVFNKVASSIKIEDAGGEVTISKHKDAEEVNQISHKRPTNANKQKDLLYGRFVRSGTTVVGNEIVKADNQENSEEDSDKELDFSSKDTLEKAFLMSGGRTAHKAARHGHKLNGKLKRLLEQENNKESIPHKKRKKTKNQSNVEQMEIKKGKVKLSDTIKGDSEDNECCNSKLSGIKDKLYGSDNDDKLNSKRPAKKIDTSNKGSGTAVIPRRSGDTVLSECKSEECNSKKKKKRKGSRNDKEKEFNEKCGDKTSCSEDNKKVNSQVNENGTEKCKKKKKKKSKKDINDMQ